MVAYSSRPATSLRISNPALEAGVTASALLDLTSAAWLDRLAVSADGPAHGAVVRWPAVVGAGPGRGRAGGARFVAHQRTDKGFGPALGPEAATHLADRLETQGHRITTATSDWRLGAADRPLLAAVLDGVLAAAAAIDRDRKLTQWAAIRRSQLDRAELGLIVGHVDLLALPAAA